MRAESEQALAAGIVHAPTVVIDTREQRPLSFSRLLSVRGTLQTGDYSILGMEKEVAIERKSVPDLLNSLTGARKRFMAEIDRMREYAFRRLAVIGTPAELKSVLSRRNVSLSAITGSLASLEASVPVVYFPTPEDAARGVEAWLSCYWAKACQSRGERVHQPEWAREDVMRRWNGACYQRGQCVTEGRRK